ncbi:catechol 2,3-dioxygenase-like lactoylglutathione lyase family enzyme [Silvibacterium bohemicum]|uniref:Catechol 2,3-dioxygenase-like lactoylglutathione lyase family enzyme n=1 Tax=Silvibacterium bohemicum TaxID=1577686 RepID=A0A841K5Q3_9BACT|nr:VOC family protein [Silvibacterium bohemicum]MBB6145928.1 catechol 2,3-dioxygenase-like lactoylglutathione lyase family enzyme [Silvibacterium bohemicum]
MKRFFALLLLPSLAVLCPAQSSSSSQPPITGISHISVYTGNSSAAEHYYVHDIGLKKGPDPENSNGVRYYVNPDQFVEVLPLPANAGNSRLDHLAYTTTDAEALRAYLGAKGTTVPEKVEKASDGSRWFVVKDPEGNKVEFTQPAAHKIAMTGANPVGKHIIHVGMLVRSRAVEDPFYRGLLGFKPYWFGGMQPDKVDWVSQQVPNGHDWLEYMLTSGPSGGGIRDVSQKQLGVLNHLSIGVVNMEKAVTTLDSEGRLSNEHVGPQLGKDGKWQYNLFDPDETRLELMEYAPVEKPCCSSFTAPNPTPVE